jgi:hypothetical protein
MFAYPLNPIARSRSARKLRSISADSAANFLPMRDLIERIYPAAE